MFGLFDQIGALVATLLAGHFAVPNAELGRDAHLRVPLRFDATLGDQNLLGSVDFLDLMYLNRHVAVPPLRKSSSLPPA